MNIERAACSEQPVTANPIEVHTARLVLRTRTVAQMQAVADAEADPEMRTAYLEMVDAMRAIPGREQWACDWAIVRQDTGECVGGIGFKGVPDERGEVEVGYGIDEPHRRQGFATEATAALCRWALGREGVRCVLAQTVEGNQASQGVLRNAGFVRDGMGEEGPLFRLTADVRPE